MDRLTRRNPQPSLAHTGRRRALQALAALGASSVLAACGSGDTHDEPNIARIVLTDADAGTCVTRMVLNQMLELRLRVTDAQTLTWHRQRGHSWPEMRREKGPDRRVIDGITYDVWYFRAIVKGRATVHMEYTQSGSSQVTRELDFRTEVFETRTWPDSGARQC